MFVTCNIRRSNKFVFLHFLKDSDLYVYSRIVVNELIVHKNVLVLAEKS